MASGNLVISILGSSFGATLVLELNGSGYDLFGAFGLICGPDSSLVVVFGPSLHCCQEQPPSVLFNLRAIV